MKFPRLLLILPLLLWLGGCTPTVVTYEPVDRINWQQQQQLLTAIQQWNISGRISIQTEDDGVQADYRWQQYNASDYDIRLQGPMGSGTMLINGRANGVSLSTSSGDKLFDTDVDKLLYRLNGWPLPVSGLYYWVRGLPDATKQYKVTAWTENGLPSIMLQSGWRIEFRKYRKIDGTRLPAKLFISREDNEEIELRLIIRQWSLEPGGKHV